MENNKKPLTEEQLATIHAQNERLDAQNEKILAELQKAEAEGKKVPESVWADGIPENLSDNDKIKGDELLSMAVDYIMKNVIIKKGFKIEPGFPRPQFPNIVCKRDGAKYSIIIAPSVYPGFTAIDDKSRKTYVEATVKQGLIPLFASVGYRSIDGERAKAGLLLKGDVYVTTFPGFYILNDEDSYTFDVNKASMFRP
ncbi:MAG: hypothetical protein K6A63_00875 [Acholeplasmatales bacterium]|nr:hypothetical protein [Acholeplasmatales bacterium]